MELVLDPEMNVCAEFTRPLSINVAFKIEGVLFVGHVTRCDEERRAKQSQRAKVQTVRKEQLSRRTLAQPFMEVSEARMAAAVDRTSSARL
jgi:hypothetical protein